jgi:hypothetical protein
MSSASLRLRGESRAALWIAVIAALVLAAVGWSIHRLVRQRALDEGLLGAIERSDRQAVTVLLDRGADPNACEAGSLWETLLEWVRRQPHAGRRALTVAFNDCQDPAIFQQLLARGADVNAAGYGGRTILMDAAGWATPADIRLLASRGAKVDAQDQDGWTALVYALQRGNFDNARALLELKADPNLPDREGMLALDWARDEHETHNKDLTHEDWLQMTRLLARRGARSPRP